MNNNTKEEYIGYINFDNIKSDIKIKSKFIFNEIYYKDVFSGFIISYKHRSMYTYYRVFKYYITNLELIKNLSHHDFEKLENKFALQCIPKLKTFKYTNNILANDMSYLREYTKELLLNKNLNINNKEDRKHYIKNLRFSIKHFNYRVSNSIKNADEKYLKLSRTYPIEYRYKVYICCCRYGEEFYNKLIEFPCYIHSQIYDFKNNVEFNYTKPLFKKYPPETIQKHIQQLKYFKPYNINNIDHYLSSDNTIICNLNWPTIKQRIYLFTINTFIGDDDMLILCNVYTNKELEKYKNDLLNINKLINIIFNNKNIYLNILRYLNKKVSLYSKFIKTVYYEMETEKYDFDSLTNDEVLNIIDLIKIKQMCR